MNPYPRVLDHQKYLGDSPCAYLKKRLANTLALSHLPTGYGVNSDTAFVSKYMELDEKDIESIYLPVDDSPSKNAKGWAIVKITSSKKYLQWANKNVTAEGKKIIIHNTSKLLEYALSKSIQESAKEETLQIAQYIYQTYNKEEDSIRDEELFNSLNEFYLKSNEAIQKGSNTETSLDDFSTNGVSIYELKGNKSLIVNSKGLAKVIEKSKNNTILNLQNPPKHVDDNQIFALSKEDFTTFFRYMNWDLLSGVHSATKASYLSFFKSAQETVRIFDQIVEFSAPIKVSKTVLNDLQSLIYKLRLRRSKEFLDIEVIGVDDPHARKYHKKEHVSEALSSLDIYLQSEKNVSVQDINTLLNIVTNLDEQLWCNTLSQDTGNKVSDIMNSVSRPYSHLQRLSTFIGFEESYHKLAEYGYVARGDGVFQNVFDDKEITQIANPSCDIVKDTQLMKNNVNVPLSESLRYLSPTQLHKDSQIIVSKDSDFVFTFSKNGI